jgi:hypothetical protein
LTSKCEALNSNPSAAKRKERKRKKMVMTILKIPSVFHCVAFLTCKAQLFLEGIVDGSAPRWDEKG